MKLIQDLREFIGLLNAANVQFLVIGGWAYNRYAEPRFTGDLDIFLDGSPENEKLIREVLTKFGFADALPPPDRALFNKKVLMLGRPPNRIDLITEIDGLSFKEAWQDRSPGQLDGLPTNFISRQHLIANKRAAGRDKDLLDVKMLERMGEKNS